MLQELRKQAEDPQLQSDITQAIDTIQDVLDQANEAIHKEHLAAAVVDLSERVDDWKSLKMDSFGELLRFGTFAVVKGDSGKDNEREVRFCIPYISAAIPISMITNPRTSVPYLPFRAYSSVLQGHQSQQAED